MNSQVKVIKNIYTCPGDTIAPVYEKVFDEKTKKSSVQKTKDFNIYEFIQASNSQTDLAMLRQEMIASGQIPVLDEGVVDCTLFPENIHELHKVVNSAEKTFNELPDTIKVVFGNKDNFLASLTKGTYEQDIMDYYKKNTSIVSKTNVDQVMEEPVNE